MATATPGTNSVIRVWDVAALQESASFAGHKGIVSCLAFSPDGRYLVSGSADTTLLVWDLAEILPPKQAAKPPSDAELQAAWQALAGGDGKAAHRAIFALASAPERSVPLLRAHLRPASAVAPHDVTRWIKQLDDPAFAVREKATAALEKAGTAAEAYLKRALDAKPSLELKRRLEELLAKVTGPVADPEILRSIRAIEVLEWIATPQAIELLQSLAQGASEARQTREAKAALGRLAKRK